MLIQLLPDQIPEFWEDIKYSLEESAPPLFIRTQEQLNNILMSLLAEKMQCWVSVDTEKDPHEIKGVMTSTIINDGISGTRMFLLYSGYSTGEVEDSFWIEGLKVFKKYAKSKRCKLIGAYSSIPYMKERFAKLGANLETFGYWVLED